jgi:HAD superfamily hydrolase (TIGR01509 family)
MSCQLTGCDTDQVSDCVSTWFEREPLGLLHRFIRPGLVNFLASARQRGIKLAVLSDYPAEAKLTAMRLREYFDLVVSAQDDGIQCFKPNPAGLEFTLQKLGVNKDNAVYVGDRLSVDVEAARRAGVRAIIVGQRQTATNGRPYLMVRDFNQLKTVLCL